MKFFCLFASLLPLHGPSAAAPEVRTFDQAAAFLYDLAVRQNGIIQGGTFHMLYDWWPGLKDTIQRAGGLRTMCERYPELVWDGVNIRVASEQVVSSTLQVGGLPTFIKARERELQLRREEAKTTARRAEERRKQPLCAGARQEVVAAELENLRTGENSRTLPLGPGGLRAMGALLTFVLERGGRVKCGEMGILYDRDPEAKQFFRTWGLASFLAPFGDVLAVEDGWVVADLRIMTALELRADPRWPLYANHVFQ